MRTVLTLLLILSSIPVHSQQISKYLVIDQFGYRPESEKIVVIRNPISGFDEEESFEPGDDYALVNALSNETVFSGGISQWKDGNTDNSSGDQVWWFNFSSYTTPGTYYILDVSKNVRSYTFEINENVYNEVLKHAVRTFYYQRAGYEKEEKYAGNKWADKASHLGLRQDANCRRFDNPANFTLERDLSGGWYDAGDYNKYTPWTANYIVDLLRSYEENPDAWGDNYCLPTSGNGVPDLIDEVKWGLDYLLKLQETDGSLISIVDLGHATPPSQATEPSLYGNVNTTSALAGAAAYAYGAIVFETLQFTEYAEILKTSAIDAWNWAIDNPNVIWKNNSSEFNSVGIGAGQQETDDYGRFAYKVKAATYLWNLTKDDRYKSFLEGNYQNIHLIQWSFAFPFETDNQSTLLYLSNTEGISQTVTNDIKTTYRSAMESEYNFGAITSESDPYLSYLKDYVWGSNGTKSNKGLMFTDYVQSAINTDKDQLAMRSAERYIHYIHGLNPLNFCYLSNMLSYGADNGVSQFYHTWFDDGSDWDIAGVDKYGPAPGFLVGGANPTYDWDSCCPNNCSGNTCDAELRNKITSQPQQKAYEDFNTNWPMNSWSLSENSCGYQTAYIRLLSKFVTNKNNTEEDCSKTIISGIDLSEEIDVKLYPNPASKLINITSRKVEFVRVITIDGKNVLSQVLGNNNSFSVEKLPAGLYVIKLYDLNGNLIKQEKLIKQEQ